MLKHSGEDSVRASEVEEKPGAMARVHVSIRPRVVELPKLRHDATPAGGNTK